MGKETSRRIQTSILNAGEKKLLIWLARRQPRWMTSDTLTYLGVFGSLLFVVGGILSNWCVEWLWLSSFGLFIHWYGDSLDGTLARVRNTQRPVYGFFIDHTLDAITTFFIFLGAGLSPVLRMDVSLLGLAGYLCLAIYTYVCTILKGEFRLTYAAFGPTEFRLLLILLRRPGCGPHLVPDIPGTVPSRQTRTGHPRPAEAFRRRKVNAGHEAQLFRTRGTAPAHSGQNRCGQEACLAFYSRQACVRKKAAWWP